MQTNKNLSLKSPQQTHSDGEKITRSAAHFLFVDRNLNYARREFVRKQNAELDTESPGFKVWEEKMCQGAKKKKINSFKTWDDEK